MRRMPQAFKGKPPGSGSGEMSRRTAVLRPSIALSPAEATKARALRRKGAAPEEIAALITDVGARREELDNAGVRAREVYERAFTFSRVSAQVEDVYSRLLDGR